MRLLIVTQYFWPENFRINDLAQDMVRKGHQVTVLTGFPNYPDGIVFEEFKDKPSNFAEYSGVKIIRVPLIPRGKSKLMLLANYLSFVISASSLGILKLAGRQFDVIFACQLSPATAAFPAVILRTLRRVPMVMWVLDLWPESLTATVGIKSKTILGVIGSLVGFIYRHCDLILSQSRGFIPKISERAPGVSVKYFPSWAESVFDDNKYSPAPEVQLLSGSFNIMFAGNVGESQDFPSILKAAENLKEHKNIRWLIVGDGRMADWVAGEVIRRGLEDTVLLLGRYPLERMPEFFEHADAMLITLKGELSFSLTIPGKLQSYLKAGKPVLAMLDGEGASVVEKSGAGLVCAAGDHVALGRLVLDMAEMTPEDRGRMGECGRNYYAQEFDRRVLLDRFEDFLLDIEIHKG